MTNSRLNSVKTYLKFLFKVELILLIIQEASLWALLDGKFSHAFSFLNHRFIFGVMVAFTFTALLFVLFNRLKLALLISTSFIFILTVIHYFKVMFLGLPLYFWDYVLALEGLRVLDILITDPIWYAVAGAGAVGLVVLCFFLARKDRLRLPLADRLKIAGFGLAVVIPLFFLFKIPYEGLFPANSFRDSRVVRAGLVGFLTLSAHYVNASPSPEGYSEEEVKKILDKYPDASEANGQDETTANSQKNPDLIFYVLESVMDYRALGIHYQTDPMPYFNRLSESFPSGVFVSPTFGGKTIQPEFEFMTGLSQFLLNSPNPMAFINQSRDYFPTLCTPLHARGYYCLGINGSSSNNFQRDQAYTRFGFDRFFGMDTEFKDKGMPRFHGRVPDAFMVETFFKELPKDKPVFSYIMTNSTHASYKHFDRLPEYEITNQGLSEVAVDTLTRYGSALKQADDAIEKFISSYQATGREGIIFIYGDHLPGISEVFAELKLPERKNWHLYEKYKTPLRIWSSKPLGIPRELLISPNLIIGLLPSLFSNWAALPIQFRIAGKLFESWDVLSMVLIDKKGHMTTRKPDSAKHHEVLKDYEMIQYDLLHGKRYSLKLTPQS